MAYVENVTTNVVCFNLFVNMDTECVFRNGFYTSDSFYCQVAICNNKGTCWGWSANMNSINVIETTYFHWYAK